MWSVCHLTGPNALAVEYQAMYRDTRGNLRFAYSLNHADLFRPCGVFGPGFLASRRKNGRHQSTCWTWRDKDNLSSLVGR